jgi:DNA-binding HxlR family transcriptional regulator
MRRKSFDDMRCSVAQTLEVVGEWWTFLVVRDLFLGVHRFDDIQRRLGISRNVLTERLDHLVTHGVVERRPYQERPLRHEYVLTDKGRSLWPVLSALREWGDQWAAPDGPPVEVVHRDCGGHPRVEHVCPVCGEVVRLGEVRAVAGPGGDPDEPILPARRPDPADEVPVA